MGRGRDLLFLETQFRRNLTHLSAGYRDSLAHWQCYYVLALYKLPFTYLFTYLLTYLLVVVTVIVVV